MSRIKTARATEWRETAMHLLRIYGLRNYIGQLFRIEMTIKTIATDPLYDFRVPEFFEIFAQDLELYILSGCKCWKMARVFSINENVRNERKLICTLSSERKLPLQQ